MKSTFNFLIQLLVIMLLSTNVRSAELNFGTKVYFTAPDSTTLPGTLLTSSGSTLSGFDFSTAPATHAIYKSGIYYPVTDCQGHNLWVRFRHVAADPNGQNYGILIAATTGLALYGGPNMIGGFTGFLYQIEIYRDQNLTGSRANILGPLYPTTVTVASLETLAYPGGPHEWLCFQIQDANSTGWNLNSTNFTGSNPNSHPGFSPRPVEVTPGNQATYLPKFSENFPTGRDSIYAITLPIGGFSEFKMTANQVSRFQYGYEFSTFGYQGMSMAFGEGPVVKDSVVDEKCYRTGGSIYLKPSGLGPYTYNWSNGSASQNLLNVAPGPYSATVTDENGCISQVSKTILPGPVFTNELSQVLLSGDTLAVLSTTITGGIAPLSYLWNTGSTNDSLWVDSNGVYVLTVKDASDCLAKDTIVVTQFLGIGGGLNQNGIKIFPNPAIGKVVIQFQENQSGQVRLVDLNGKELIRNEIAIPAKEVSIDLKAVRPGMYLLFFKSPDALIQVKMVKD